MRFCLTPHCKRKVESGYCLACQEKRRGRKASAHRRGYTARWDRFRTVEFPDLLLDRGIVPACGARLAPGPSPHSRCAADGVVTMSDLELDHEPPLTETERQDPLAVCDPDRVAFLCKADHTRKTNQERRRTA